MSELRRFQRDGGAVATCHCVHGRTVSSSRPQKASEGDQARAEARTCPVKDGEIPLPCPEEVAWHEVGVDERGGQVGR